jgi:hypothetical protein
MASNRGGIVDGYARGWPREIFDLRAKVAGEIEFLKKPGVYVLYNDGTPHYIGQAASMFSRLKTHARPQSRYYNFWNTFSAFAVSNQKGRDELEAILIAAMPTANSAKPKLNKMRLPLKVVSLMRKIRDAKLKQAIGN